MKALLIVVLAVTLAGCGVKGPLERSEPVPERTAEPISAGSIEPAKPRGTLF